MFWTKYSELCHAKGEAPNYVAAKVGVKSTGTVSGWKKGAMPRDGVLFAIAEYFNVPVDYFSEKEMPAPDGNELNMGNVINNMSREELIEFIMLATSRLKDME